jgi:hypothetical protein
MNWPAFKMLLSCGPLSQKRAKQLSDRHLNSGRQSKLALAIHDKAINDGHYSGESRGKGMNYETIVTRVYTCKKALQNQNKQTV